ncbi:MAG: DUF5107 domain-containing protein [Phycisphaerales bacterium]
MNDSRRDQIGTMAAILLGLCISTPGWAKVQAWEGTITIPTYGWAEDVNPKFWALEDRIKLSTTVKGAIVYPYTMQDHLYRVKEDRTYKALFLENEYLKVTCLPELGGRLHSVFDKTQGKETFHLNNVIKPSMIAMRGAFISGGVEWNAGPQVHTVTVLSPVDALVGTNPDGSAYLEVSNLEKTLRTRWTVRVTLHPGKAYLDEQIRIANPVDAVNPYYFWNCTAFPCHKGTRFIYPMTLGTDHYGVQFFSWPINEGKDLSWLKNYETWASIFSVDCVFDFFGGYDVPADRGVVQVAEHYELSGKMAWTWGQWDFGLVSQKNLTDNDGPYIEIQSGPLPTQSDYGMLAPRQEVAWREWWYPVHGLGDGFEFATKDVAVQTSREGDGLKLRILTTGKFPKASCVLTQQGKELVSKQLDLSPSDPQTVVLSPRPEGPVDVSILTRQGVVLAQFTTPLPIPKTDPPVRAAWADKADAGLTIEEKFLKAQKLDLAMNRKKAREAYEAVLADDSGYAPALRALAILDTEAALCDKAIERLQKAVERDPSDGLAWYFLGVNRLRTHAAKEALGCARQASLGSGVRALALDLAGRAHASLGDKQAAVEAFQTAANLNPKDSVARDHLLVALYAAGDAAAAFKQAQEAVDQHPTDLVPRAILALQGSKQMDVFAAQAREFVGEDDFEMLETSLLFAELGLTREAAKLVSAVCVDAVPANERSPLPLYYMAWFAKGTPVSGGWLQRAATTRRDCVFPSRPEELEVFEYAIAENPQDAQARLLIGDLCAHLGRTAEAAGHWQKAVELDPSLSVAWRNLGLYAWAEENDLTKAAESYRKAIDARPKDQPLYRDLAEILIAQEKRPDAIKLLESTPPDKLRRADVIVLLAQSYLDEELHDDTIKLLESTPYVVNWEGQTITWDLYHKAHMARGRIRFDGQDFAAALADFEAALAYPENIGVGRSNKPQEAAAQYWRGKALQSLGRLDQAKSAWREGAVGVDGSEDQNKHRDLCREALNQAG